MLISIFLLIIGFVVLIKGADIFVDGASGIATNFKVSKMLIGLTIVSFGFFLCLTEQNPHRRLLHKPVLVCHPVQTVFQHISNM